MTTLTFAGWNLIIPLSLRLPHQIEASPLLVERLVAAQTNPRLILVAVESSGAGRARPPREEGETRGAWGTERKETAE